MTEIPSILAEHYPFWEHLKADERHAFVSCSIIRGYEKGSFVRSDCDECLEFCWCSPASCASTSSPTRDGR